jgi:DNA-binding MarR family transcriptional regulator
MRRESLETIELELTVLIRHITSIVRDKKTIGNLDRSAYLLLRQIDRHGSAGVKALAEEFRLDISTVSRQTAALEGKGYVVRTPDPNDGRACSFAITESGAKEMESCRQARLDRLTEKLGEWTDEESIEFGKLLEKFNRTF